MNLNSNIKNLNLYKISTILCIIGQQNGEFGCDFYEKSSTFSNFYYKTILENVYVKV